MKQQGVAIIYISHRLEEIKRIGDRIVVMRDGGYVGERMVTDNINLDEVIHLMSSREVTQYYPKSEHHIGEVSMEIKNLSLPKLVHDVSFQAHKGEVLGIGGLVGAGRTELMEAIFGATKISSGTIPL